MESVLAAAITGGLALLGTVVTCLATSRRTEQNIRVNQAVTDTKLDDLTREVRAHNNFAQRIPVIEEQIRVINHRIDDLEQFHKGV